MSWRKGERPKLSTWRKVRLVALDRDSWACVQCGKYRRLEVDHVQPLEDGGELYTLQNLQSLCRSCHITKSKNERSIKVDSPDVRAWKHLITESLQDMV